MNLKNRTLFIADNLDIMRGIDSQTVDLIYLDPPFKSGKQWKAPIGSPAEGAEFKDIWTNEDVKDGWYSAIAEQYPHIHQIIQAAEHTYDHSMMIYLMAMSIRLIEMHRILKSTGSIYLHCDPTASHYLKLVLDSLFGKKNFRNEIVWQRASGRAKGSQFESRSLGRDTDNIFHYSKSEIFTHNKVTQSLTEAEILEKFPHTDSNGRRYNTQTPLFCQPSMGARPNLCYEYKGVKNPHPSGWRVSKEKLIKMDEAGDIIWREGKRPLRKSYADQYAGKPIGSLWIDVPIAAGKERTGYPTQKPLALLNRIIKASSNQGDLILDPFCGCATACVAAEKLQRQWIGIDISPAAEVITKIRLDEASEQGALFSPIEISDVTVTSEPPIRTDTEPQAAQQKKLPNYTVHKNYLYGEQEGFCNGCRDHFKIRNLTVDHIVPQSKGGTDHPKNLQLLCHTCNATKGKGTQEELIDRLKTQGVMKMTLKWGVLGAGSVAQRRAMPAIQKATGAELHALFSRDATRAQKLADEHNATKAYSGINDLLTDTELDAIYISTPVNLHCEQVIAAAERGLHILCDKPMALNPQECEKMIAACDANDVHLQVCFLFRFHSCFQQIKAWVEENRLGHIVHGRMPFLKKYLLTADEWRAIPEQGGGGCMMDLGPHSVDMLRYLIGEVAEVTAFCGSPIYNYKVEETGGILMRFQNGAQAFTDLSFSAAQCDIVLELYGTEGTVTVLNDDGWKIHTNFDGEKKVIASQFEDLYQNQFEHFAECVATGMSPLASSNDGLRANMIIDAAYRSAKTGQVVKCT